MYLADQRPAQRLHTINTLPFRTSPNSKHTSLYSQGRHTLRPYPPPALTPVESSDDDDDGISEDYESIVPDTPAEVSSSDLTSARQPSIQVSIEDHDMDLDDTTPSWQESSPKRSDGLMLAPIRPPSHSSDNTGRLPTPIYGHFNANLSQPSLYPMAPSIESDWTRRGRLPSPVYDEDEPMSPAMGEAMDTLKLSTPTSIPSSSAFEPQHDRGHAGLFERPRGLTRSGSGRARGGAISAGAGEGGGKTSRLFVGFKSDCEKCQMRVPGHYSHIIRD